MTTSTVEKISFRNELCFVTLQNDKSFYGADLTDIYNGTAMYTKNVQSFKKGVAKLQAEFNEKTTFWQMMSMLESVNLRPRSYCSVD